MNSYSKGAKRLIICVGAMVTYGCWLGLPAASVPAVYVPAYFEHIPTKLPKLILFLGAGAATAVPLPLDLPEQFRLIEYSSDGRALYGQEIDSWNGITKVEFTPSRRSLIAGSEGFGTVSSIVSLNQGRLLISGLFKSHGTVDCGIFDFDTNARTARRLFKGSFPNCGGAISADGKRSIQFSANHLSIVDLDTGQVHPVGEGLSGATWSPDGRWIAAVRGTQSAASIALIDARQTELRRSLGPTEDSQAHWSPDSKYLLIAKPQPSQCGPDLWSLEIVDVETGKRREVKGAHCKIFQNSTGWLDKEVAR
jgi:dipeptidyl aminopeptidase/acylaminoacyl peptidase